MIRAQRDDQPLIGGRRALRALEEQLAQLHAQPAHGNRSLQADHVLVAHLMAFFNPTIRSLRTIEDLFENKDVRARTGMPRVPRSTLSDAQQVFNLEALQPLVQSLLKRLKPLPRDERLEVIASKLIAVDATFFEVAPRIVWALPRHKNMPKGSVQWCVHYDVFNATVDRFTLIDGSKSERAELPKNIDRDRFYLLDRAYQSYDHLAKIVELDSDFLVRLRSSAAFETLEQRPLSTEAKQQGILRDEIVQPTSRRMHLPFPVRLVEIASDEDDQAPVRLLTNRTDLSADVISVLYRHRWQVELFFRWIKCVVPLRHFMGESLEAITLQLYAAVIGSLLIAIETGRNPSKYELAQVGLVYQGISSWEAAWPVIKRRRAESDRAAARAREKRKA